MKNKVLSYFQILLTSLNYLLDKNFNEKKFISENIHENSIVFDIGSNLGSFIKAISKTNKSKNINFYSFEPIEDLCNFQRNIKLPPKHKLNIVNTAVSDNNTPKEFYVRNISSLSSLDSEAVVDQIGNVEKKLTVECIKLDDFCDINNIKQITLLKIDVEGHDFQVLTSASELFRTKKIKVIKIELTNSKNNLSQIFSFFHSFGYDFIGTTNNTYFGNKLSFFDGYFKLA